MNPNQSSTSSSSRLSSTANGSIPSAREVERRAKQFMTDAKDWLDEGNNKTFVLIGALVVVGTLGYFLAKNRSSEIMD